MWSAGRTIFRPCFGFATPIDFTKKSFGNILTSRCPCNSSGNETHPPNASPCDSGI